MQAAADARRGWVVPRGRRLGRTRLGCNCERAVRELLHPKAGQFYNIHDPAPGSVVIVGVCVLVRWCARVGCSQAVAGGVISTMAKRDGFNTHEILYPPHTLGIL